MAAKERESQEINIIGQSTYIDGTIKSQGNLRIDGHVHGSIATDGNFVVGLTGEVDGAFFNGHCQMETTSANL